MSGDDLDRRFDAVAETRRHWSLAEKRKIVAEACVPFANVSAVARRHGVKPAVDCGGNTGPMERRLIAAAWRFKSRTHPVKTALRDD